MASETQNSTENNPFRHTVFWRLEGLKDLKTAEYYLAQAERWFTTSYPAEKYSVNTSIGQTVHGHYAELRAIFTDDTD